MSEFSSAGAGQPGPQYPGPAHPPHLGQQPGQHPVGQADAGQPVVPLPPDPAPLQSGRNRGFFSQRQGQRSVRPEFRVAAVRQHARRVILPSLVLVAAAATIGYSFRGLREPGDWIWWAIVAGVVAVLFGIVPIIGWLRHRYQITTVRTISSRGLIRSVKSEIAHHQVVNVEMKRNPWQAIFGSGTILLTAVNGHVFELRDVPNAVTIAQALRELTGNVNRAASD